MTSPIVAEEFTDGWKAENAQNEMEQILTANNDDIQAVLSQNDNMATGVAAALGGNTDGKVKIGAQDGDKVALNRVALGTQVVSVWKDATELGTAGRQGGPRAVRGPRHLEGDRRDGVQDDGRPRQLRRSCSSRFRSPRTTSRSSWTPSGSPRTKLCKDVTAGSVDGC